MPQPNCQPIRYCWDAEKVKNLIRLRAELSPLFTGKRNASKYAWTVVEQELKVPLPLSKIIKKWNNLLQEYKAIKLSEEPKRREWPFFTLMDLYFSDQVNDPTLRLFSSTKTFGNDTIDDKEELHSALAAAAFGSGAMSGGALMDISDMMQETQSDKTDVDTSDERETKFNLINNNNNNNNSTSNNNNNNNNNNSSNINNNNSSTNNNNSSKPSLNNNNTTTNNNNTNINNNNNYGYKNQHHLTPDYDDNSEYSSDLDKTRNDILSRASEHHNIDQYLLSWNNFHGNMCKGFHNLQKDGQMVDVTIAAGGKIFKAHKLVLSVCSPYFQKIFLDNPSTHPILFMTDVNSNYMAGLLDFMYSGQVNVKYGDLPSFLKVAEAMQIKGLHTESTNDAEEKESPKYQYPTSRPPTGNASPAHQNRLPHQIPQHLPTKYHQSQATHQQTYQDRIQEASFLQRQTLNLSQNRNHSKDLLASPKSIEDIQNNNSSTNNNNNNNNNNSNNNNNNNNNIINSNSSPNINNNTTTTNNNNTNNSKFVIQQTNINNKLLDSQKYQKYYAKRKLIAQYEQEMRNKRARTPSSIVKEDTNRNYKTSITSDDTDSSIISNIKLEPEDHLSQEDVESNDSPLSLKHSNSSSETNQILNEGRTIKSPDHLSNTAVKSS